MPRIVRSAPDIALGLADGMARLERALRLCMAAWGAKPEALARRASVPKLFA